MKTRLKWGDINALNAKIDEYFDKEIVPTIAGLCLHLGVSKEFWKYYISDKWQTKRKSEEEIEEIRKINDDMIENEGFTRIEVVSPTTTVIDPIVKESETDSLKRQISEILRKTQLRIDDFTMKQVFTAKNPAGAIYYSKVALGYRENDTNDMSNNNVPSKIVINIMPPPDNNLKLQVGSVDIKND